MIIGQSGVAAPTPVVATGTAFALLVALAGASRAARDELPGDVGDALAATGDTEGESWLNLLGVALDMGPPYTAARLRQSAEAMDPVALRLHLLGRHAWSWCTLAGIDDIEAAATGDAAATSRLLAQPRYYGGHAATSLAVLLPLPPEETRDRIVAGIAAAESSLLPADASARLRAANEKAESSIAGHPPLVAIERITGGYRYAPEPEAERIVLVPHLERRLPLVLAQHRGARLIAYHAAPARTREDRLVALGRALADPKRVEVLALVGRGVGRAADLVDATGLTRSTVHHHLALLRDAGLVALEGNARAYTYVPRGAAVAEAAALVADLIGSEEQ